MNVIIYGDFNSLLSYLASQRADWLVRTGAAEIDWRAVEHRRQLTVTASIRPIGLGKELAEAGALALPGERAAATPPPMVSNTRASVAAYAEAVTDGVEDELRCRLFEAIWAQRRNLSGPIRRTAVITEVVVAYRPIVLSPGEPRPARSDPRMTRPRCGSCAGKAGRSRPTAGPDHHRIRANPAMAAALAGAAPAGHPGGDQPSGTADFGADGLRFLAGIAGSPAIARDTAPGLPGGHAAYRYDGPGPDDPDRLPMAPSLAAR